MDETRAEKLAREMSHKQGKANQSERDTRLEGSAMQALARGWLAGTIGMPGDLEGLARMGINKAGGNVDKMPAMPDTDFYKTWLPGKQPGDEAMSTAGSLLGGVGVGTMAKGVAKPVGALSRVAGRTAERAGMAAERALDPVVMRALERGGKPAQLLHDLAQGSTSNVIKAPGGNWLSGSVEDALKGLKQPNRVNYNGTDITLEQARNWPRLEPDASRAQALNQFIDKQLTRYVKKDMATERDPIRALAERGISHADMGPFGPAAGETVSSLRKAAGFPIEGFGKSDTAKTWENVSDAMMRQKPASYYQQGIGEVDDWLKKVAPDTKINQVKDNAMSNNLGFDHLIDELRNATNPASGLPRELLLKPESLDRVSIPQAVEHVAKINAWREAQKVAANEGLANNAATHVFKEYAENNPKGLKWVELKQGKLPEDWAEEFVDTDLGKLRKFRDPKTGGLTATDPTEEALRAALKYEGDTMGHCVGGYCDDVASGKSRIYSLRDAKGQPHVTVEVAPERSYGTEHVNKFSEQAYNELVKEGLNPGTPGDMSSAFLSEMNKRTADLAKANLPQRVVQIKGKGNKKPNDEYLPFVQDFVKSGKWSDVGDLDNTGLQKWNDRFLTPAEIEALSPAEMDAFAGRNVGKQGYAEGGAVHWDSAPDANPQLQPRGDEFIQVNPEEEERKRLAAEAQAAHTARNTMSREDFLKTYGTTFRADDKGGNAASEVAGQDVAAYYDRYLAPGARGDLSTTRGAGDNLEVGVEDYKMPTFGYKYRDANPNFDAWDNARPHPVSQDLGGVGEFWRQIGRPIAAGAGLYFGVGSLGGAGAAATGSNAASGLAGQLGMSKGAMATALNTGALNTGVGLARGQDLGQALKGGVTSALLSPVGGFVGDAVGGGVVGKLVGSTAAGGLQGVATGRGLTDGLQQGLVSGIANVAGNYIGGQTGSNFAGKAASALTKATLSGQKPGSTIDSLATQYAAGELSDLSGLDPATANIVVNLARNKRVSPVGALSALSNSRRAVRG
jgi:hypothetical protein